MKKILVVLSVLLLVAIVACSPVAPKVDDSASDDSVDSSNDDSSASDTQPEPEQKKQVEEKPQAKEDSSEVGRTEPVRPLPSERPEVTVLGQQ